MGKTLAVWLALCLVFAPLTECAAAPGAAPRAVALPQDNQDDSSYQQYSPEQLDNLLAPIALYPDPLLAQVLLAATFVDQIDEAERYVRAYGQAGVDDQEWDVSVKAVAHYPTVLTMMADKLDWTTALGQAYVYQSTDVMMAVQRLRGMAHDQGNLVSTPEQEIVEQDGIYSIYPAQPQYIYVPVYQPSVIYFRRAYYDGGWLGGVFAFGTGFLIGVWLNHDCDWREHRVFYTGWRGDDRDRRWVERSRPYVQVTNVYVNNRYTNVTVNRTVINRPVNYDNINRYHAVHREVTYDDHARGNQGRNYQGQRPAVANAPGRVNNGVINRNINTNDPNLEQYRGRSGTINMQGRPQPSAPPHSRPEERPAPPPNRPAAPPPPPPQAQPQPQQGGYIYGRGESRINPRDSSRRGQESRNEMSHPPAVANAPHPAPSAPRPAPSAPRPAPAPQRPSGKRP
jgi:hypothetical protein